MDENKIPKLPEKLAPEFRKKLSIIFANIDDNNKSLNILNESSSDSSDEANNEYYKEPIEQPSFKDNSQTNRNSSSCFNNSIYLSFDNANNESSFDSESTKNESENSYLSLNKLELSSPEVKVESNIKDSIPPIPPKRTKRILSLSSLLLNKKDESKKRESLDENYIKPIDCKIYNFELFKSEIYRNEENKKCADCKRENIFPTWFSGLHFILLCETCAEIHLKLGHIMTRFYIIEIKQLFTELEKSKIGLNVETFLSILNKTGNENFNSLLEYKQNKKDSLKNLEYYIKEKYINKKYINDNEIDLKQNYIEELNKCLFKQVLSPSLIMCIYYLSLGANFNYFQSKKTILNNCIESNQQLQTLYLLENKSVQFNDLNDFYFNNLQLIGELTQIFNFNNHTQDKKKVLFKLNSENEIILTQIKDFKQKAKISLKEIVKVYSLSENTIEIKWCSNQNHSILVYYFEFFSLNEKLFWLKYIFFKLLSLESKNLCSNETIFNLADQLSIQSIGYLSILNEFCIDENSRKALVVCLQSLESQIENFFFKYILVIDVENDPFYELVDVRKINKIKFDQNILTIDTNGSKSFKFKSDGYGENLKLWYERLLSFVRLENRSIEEQYLTKDNYPISIDKLCAHTETFYLTDKQFYFYQSRLPSFKFDFKLDQNKKYSNLLSKLDQEKEYMFDLKETTPNLILNLFKTYFIKYLRKEHFKMLNFDTIQDLKISLSNSNQIFYSSLKRICLHLNFISKYDFLNEMSINYLSSLFSRLISEAKIDLKFDLEEKLKILVENCEFVFDLKQGYLKSQYQIFDKMIQIQKMGRSFSASLNTNYLITIFLFHKHSEQSFQIQIDTSFTCKQALVRAQQEFKFYESKYWCLFEVFDYDQHLLLNGVESGKDSDGQNCVLLERILPTSARLIDSISNWNSFNFVVKYNFVQIDLERYFLTQDSSLNNVLSFFDKCELLILCELCGKFRTSFQISNSSCNSNLHKKWRKSFVSVQNANLRILEGNLKIFSDIENSKMIYEEKIEECKFYYGLYEHSSLNLSSLQSLFNESNEELSLNKIFNTKPNEVIINEEECLTIYDQKQKLVYLIHLENKELALTRYSILFRMAFYPDTWSVFSSDQMPDLKPKIPETIRRSIN